MKRFLLLVVLAVSLAAHGQNVRGDFSLTTAMGQAVSGASVYVLSQPASTTTFTPTINLFGSLSGSGAAVCGGAGGLITNPLTTDQFGHACAYFSPGVYTVCYVSPLVGTQCYLDQSYANTSGSVPPQISPQEIGTTFLADGFPSSCTVSGTTYTTQLDCAWRTALASTASVTESPTVIVSSGTAYTTCAGLPMILPGATSSISVNLSTWGGTSGHNAGNFAVSQPATITQTCAISTGTLSLPQVGGSAFKQLTVLGISLDANHLAPYAMQILGENESSVFRDIQVANGTTGPAVLGVAFDFTNGFTVNATIDNWQIVDNCSTGLCGGGGAVTVSLSGGVPSFAVTNPGNSYDSNTLATLVGYQNGTRNIPCNTVGVTTPVISGGLLTGITSTASGCSGAVYVHLSDQRKPSFGLDLENVTDSRINGLDIRTGAIAGLFCQSCGSDVFTGVHAWGQGLYGIQSKSFATFVGTDCGEVSLACFDNLSTFAKTTAYGTMYNSGSQFQGYSLFRNETSTGEFQIFGVICQTTQTAEYHTLANVFGVIDTNAGATNVNTLGNSLKDVEYCGSGTGETLNVIPGNETILGSINSPATTSLTNWISFVFNSTPFVDCTAYGWTKAPTVSGAVITFPSDGTSNGGSVSCTDFKGRVVTQSVPLSGTPTVSQTFNLTTQFAVSGATWVQMDPLFASGTIFVNAPNGLIVQQGGVTSASTTMFRSSVTLTNGAAAATGTLTNGPTAGNPTKWIPIIDNGVTRFIPAW